MSVVNIKALEQLLRDELKETEETFFKAQNNYANRFDEEFEGELEFEGDSIDLLEEIAYNEGSIDTLKMILNEFFSD